MTISLCMIVKDEAATLDRCLASVAEVVDEIIVVDTGSVDATQAIAARHNARVYTIDWPQDFSVARNISLSYATGDWVLVLDGDEVLDKAAGQQLKQLAQSASIPGLAAANVVAVNLLRQEVGAPQSPYTLITRFFRRLPTIAFNRPYHETVDDSIANLQHQQPQWQVMDLDHVAIYHTGYTPELVLQRNKFDRAKTLMEGYLEQQPQDSCVLNKLAALYLEQNDPDHALTLLNQALENVAGLDPLTRYELFYHRGLALGHHDPAMAAQDYERALQESVLPRLQLGALINYGNLKKAQGDLLGAIALFQKAIEIAPNLAIAHYNLGVTQRLRGYLTDAIAAYQQTISLEPNYAEAHQNLGVALFKLGKLPEALESFGRAVQLYETLNPIQAKSVKERVKALGIPPALLAQSYFA
jgi:glycosyltransferase involved in cell wall biosynthesis